VRRILVISNCDVRLEALDALREVGEVDYLPKATRAEVFENLAGYDAVLCDAKVKFDREMLDAAGKVRIIATPSTGTDHLDKACMSEKGIEWIDIATEYELLEKFTATAEGAWLLLLAAIRRLPSQFERARRGEIGPQWDGPLPVQLSSLTLGIAGYGRLGRMVGQYGKAFRMRVLAFDKKTIEEEGIEQVDFDTFLAESDVISLHLHLNDETKFMFNRERIAQMKPGVILVNTARGDLLDEDALVDALESGHIGAAGVDVVHDEWDPNRAEHRLHRYARTHDNLIITPHVASGVSDGCGMARQFVAEKLATWLEEHA
jgi:D-3-phosphoglycerate dehydrogenase